MNLRRLLSHTAIYGISSILGRILNWLLTPFYVNLFPPDEFGILSDLYSFSFYWAVILTFGQETTFFRFSTSDETRSTYYNNAFANVLFLTLVFLILFGINYAYVASLLGYVGRERLLLWLMGIIVADALAALPLAKLRLEEKAQRFAFISLTNIFLTVLLNLVLILGYKQPIEVVFIVNFFASIVRLWMSMQGNYPDQWLPHQPYFKQMLNFGFFIMVAGVLSALNENIGRNLLFRLWEDGKLFMGKPYTSEALNGIYSANYKFGVIISLFTQAFRYAADPIMLKNAENKESPAFYAKVFYFYTTANLIVFVFISSFVVSIAKFNFWGLASFHFIHPAYWLGLDIVPQVLLANLFLGAFLNLSIWYKAKQMTYMGLIITGSGTLINITLNALFIPEYGYWACAYATLITYAWMAVICYGLGQKYFPVPYPVNVLAIYLIGALGVVLLAQAMPETWLAFLLKLALNAVFIGGIYWHYKLKMQHFIKQK